MYFTQNKKHISVRFNKKTAVQVGEVQRKRVR